MYVSGLNDRYVMCTYVAYVQEQNWQQQRDREIERVRERERERDRETTITRAPGPPRIVLQYDYKA